MKEVLSWSEARQLVESLRKKKAKIVTTNGCFDILHRGHLTYLSAARALGDVLLVGINSDESVRRLKGPSRPINSEKDRAALLSALRMVDGVCIFDGDSPEEWLKTLQPDIHTKGADWQGKGIPEEALLQSWNGRVIYLDYINNYSTTQIVEKIRS